MLILALNAHDQGLALVTPADENRCFRRAGFYTPAVLVADLAAAYEMPPYPRPIEGHFHGKTEKDPLFGNRDGTGPCRAGGPSVRAGRGGIERGRAPANRPAASPCPGGRRPGAERGLHAFLHPKRAQGKSPFSDAGWPILSRPPRKGSIPPCGSSPWHSSPMRGWRPCRSFKAAAPLPSPPAPFPGPWSLPDRFSPGMRRAVSRILDAAATAERLLDRAFAALSPDEIRQMERWLLPEGMIPSRGGRPSGGPGCRGQGAKGPRDRGPGWTWGPCSRPASWFYAPPGRRLETWNEAGTLFETRTP